MSDKNNQQAPLPEEENTSPAENYTSIFDKPDPDRYKKEKKPVKMKRQTRNILSAVALLLAVVLVTEGTCLVLVNNKTKTTAPFGTGIYRMIQSLMADDTTQNATSTASQTSTQYIHDLSQYIAARDEQGTLAYGEIDSILVATDEEQFTFTSTWGTETEIDEQTYEEVEVEVLQWRITDMKDTDIEGVNFSTVRCGFVATDLMKIPYKDVYAKDGSATIPQGSKTYYDECGITASNNRSTIRFQNGSWLTVIVGDETPTDGCVFLGFEYGDTDGKGITKNADVYKKIYRVEPGAVVYFTKDALYFVDNEIMLPVEQDETTYTDDGDEIEDPYFISGQLTYFDSLSVSGSAYEKDFVFKIVDEDVPGYDSYYLMTSPYTQNVDLDAIDVLLAPVGDGLTAESCLVMKATSADLKQYGLDDPAHVVDYRVKDVAYQLQIGNYDEENDTYAVMVKGNPSIMSVSAASLGFAKYDAADYASDTIYSCDITKIRTIRVQDGDGMDELFRLSHGTDASGNTTLTVTTRDGKTIDTDSFRNMYVSFLSCTSFAKVTDGKDAATPELTVSITYNDYSQTDVIRFSPYSDRRYYMSLNGMGSTVVRSTALDELTSAIQGLLQ